MTVAELRERLANVPDYYAVAVDHVMYRTDGEPATCRCRAGMVDVEPLALDVWNVLAIVITAHDCP